MEKYLLKLSYPLILMAFSQVGMLYVDKIYLANYSQDAFNACSSSGVACWAINGFFFWLVSSSNPLVAQYYGLKNYREISKPVLQMFLVVFLSIFIFLFFGIYGGELIFPETRLKPLQIEYFSYMMCFGPIVSMVAILSSFFNGQKKTLFVFKTVLFSTIVNICLNPILIFGLDGILPPLGVKGSAIATCLSSFFQGIILLYFFLKTAPHLAYRIDINIIKKCLKIGLPSAISHIVELGCWGIYYVSIVKIDNDDTTIASICLNFLSLFSCVPKGIAQGVLIISSNKIGGKKYDDVYRVLLSGLYLFLLFSCALFVLMVSRTDLFMNIFLSDVQKNDPMFLELASKSFLIFFFFYLAENVRYIITMIFMASGDVVFLVWLHPTSLLGCLLLPTYLFVIKLKSGMIVANLIAVLYSTVFLLSCLSRLLKNKWKTVELLGEGN